MEKGKKQKRNAAPAAAPPQKKIKKLQNKKDKAPLSTPSSSAPVQGSPSKSPTLPSPSGPAKVTPAKENGAKGAAASGKSESSEKRVEGYIFFCNGKTKAECFQHRVFGLPKGKLEEVEKIKKGTKLFLFDYNLKLVYGVYKAVSNGGMNLEPRAFNGNFPAQVKFKVFKDCYPIPESSLRVAIKDNYNGSRFKPELNFEQVKNLLSLLQPIKNNSQSAFPKIVEERHAPLPLEERPRFGGRAYASTQVDPRYAPPIATHVQNDPYIFAAHVTRGPPLMEHAFVPAPRLPPPTGEYHPVAIGLPPPNDAYRTAATSVQTDSRAYYPQSSGLLERYRAIPQIMLPNELPPAPGRDYPASLRDYRSVTVRESEMAPRMELANQYYSTGRAVASAAELPPQHNGWDPGYESSNRMYADDINRPISSRANVANLPVSSLYSFAGAAPAYR